MEIYFFLLLLTLNVPSRIGKCTPEDTCTPGWDPCIKQQIFVTILSLVQFLQGVDGFEAKTLALFA